MKFQVRYYSRSGNTKSLAESIAKAAGVNAVSIVDENSSINEKTDILFIGGALYAYGLDEKIVDYISKLDAAKIDKAFVFSTSWISKHSITLLKKALEKKGIFVCKEFIHFKNKPTEQELKKAEECVKSIINS